MKVISGVVDPADLKKQIESLLVAIENYAPKVEIIANEKPKRSSSVPS